MMRRPIVSLSEEQVFTLANEDSPHIYREHLS